MRELFIAGSKLLGIYFLYSALNTLPYSISVVFSILSNRSIFQGFPIFDLFASVLSGLVMLAFAFALLFKTESIAAKVNISSSRHASNQQDDKLEPGIILIGIYIFCTRLGVLAEVFASNQTASKISNPFAATHPQGLAFSSNYIAPGVTLITALLLIFGAKHITAILRKEKQTGTERGS